MDEADDTQFQEESEKEKDKRHGLPSYSIEKLFSECNCKDSYTKMTEELDIDAYLFWTMNKDEFNKVVEIKPWGASQRLNMRREQLWKEHKDACNKADQDKKTRRLSEDDRRNIKEMLARADG